MLLVLALLALGDPPAVPNPALLTPTPTPAAEDVRVPRLMAALDVTQGDGGERIALFDDLTLVHAVRFKGRLTSSRKTLSTNEREVVEAVLKEALRVSEEDWSSPVLVEKERRSYRLEVADGPRTRSYRFDDLSRLPLAIGRVRGAMQDLQSRFFVPDRPKSELWDPARVKEGDLLRRRLDGRWFRVVRDDSMNTNLEMLDIGPGGLRFFLTREDVPRVFEDPATQDAPEGARQRP